MLGASLALARFKRERAIERRLDWCEKMNDAFLEMVQILDNWCDHIEQNEPVDPERWQRQMDRIDELDRVFDSYLLYAPERAIPILESAVKQARQSFGHILQTTEIPPERLQEYGVEVRQLQRFLRRVAKQFAIEVRHEFSPSFWPSNRARVLAPVSDD